MVSSWAEAQAKQLPPLSGDSRDEKAGKELATDGRESGGIWNEPKEPHS